MRERKSLKKKIWVWQSSKRLREMDEHIKINIKTLIKITLRERCVLKKQIKVLRELKELDKMKQGWKNQTWKGND